MNVTDQTPAHGVNIAALAGETSLQAQARSDPSSPFATQAELAAFAGLPHKNIEWELDQLRNGLLVADASTLSADALHDAGGGALLRIPVDRLLPHPFSPHRALDYEGLILAEIKQLDRRDAPKKKAMAGYWSPTRDNPK